MGAERGEVCGDAQPWMDTLPSTPPNTNFQLQENCSRMKFPNKQQDHSQNQLRNSCGSFPPALGWGAGKGDVKSLDPVQGVR